MTTTGQVLTWNSGLAAPLQFEWTTQIGATAAPVILTPVGQHAKGGDTTTEVDGDTRAFYLGRIAQAYTTAKIVCRVTTAYVAGAGTPWAEFAICEGKPKPYDNASLSVLGYTDVSAVINTTGVKSVSVTITGAVIGDDLWVAWGADSIQGGGGTSPSFDAYVPDSIRSGMFQYATARPSTMASPTAFAEMGGATNGMWCLVGLS